LAWNVSLRQSYLKIAMAGKGGKSGKRAEPGKRGVRDNRESDGRRRLE